MSEIQHSRKTLYKIITFAIPILLILLVEGLLRLFSYGHNVDLIIDHPSEKYDKYYAINPYVGEKYFNRFEATSSTNDIFLKQKPENGFRIFVMGSSTTFGFPYDRNLMASRILEKRLHDAYPEKVIEVVNTSITAINSITLKDYIDQILDYDPDTILFYAGHNEFYGAFGVASNEKMSENAFLQSFHFNLMNLRIYQLLRSGIFWISEQVVMESESSDRKGTLMKRIVNDQHIVYKGEKYTRGIQQYKNNLSYILDKAKEEGIPFLLSDLVSNVKDVKPFGDIVEENLSAKVKYRDANLTLIKGDTLLAKELFYEAKDFDPIRFRASEEINQIIYNLVEQGKAILIPAKEKFSNSSMGGLMGDNLFTEHVHPNIDGQFILADAFYSEIVESKLISDHPNSQTEKSKGFYRYNWGYTALDSLMGVYVVKQLKSYWPFTTLENQITFRDTFNASGLIDSLAFTFLTNPDGSIDSLHNYLGEYYVENNQLSLASKEYEALIKINPYRSDYYNKAANNSLKMSDLYAAENYLLESIKYIKTNFAFSTLGEIEFLKHNFNKAADYYNLALELSDEEKIHKDNIIILLKKLGAIYKLNNDSNKLKKAKDELSNLGYNGNIPEVQPKFEYSKYIPLNIQQPFSKALYYYSNKIDSAIFYLNYCLKINDCPLVNFTIGNLLYSKRDERVLSYYEKAYSAYKNDPSFLARLCIANIANREKNKAKKILNELININPSYQDINKLKALVNKSFR